jgi:tRNA-Thr(GGU) m(6)t(6)A37 methyltransferase TsaA
MEPISTIMTPFHEKFGVPRQSLLITEAWGKMIFKKNNFFMEAFRGIELSSHLWLIFEFHQIPDHSFNGLVRPPRFKNKVKMGVYATRTPHRPNRLGMSLVEFDRLEFLDDEIILWVKGVDVVSGTPLFDIKPYVPYVDSVQAYSPFIEKPEFLNVVWRCEKLPESLLIEKVISLDPRPSQNNKSLQEYGVSISGYNIRFRYLVDHFEIISVIGIK